MMFVAGCLIALGLLLMWMGECFERASHRPTGHLPQRRHFDRRGRVDPKWLGPHDRRRGKGRRKDDR